MANFNLKKKIIFPIFHGHKNTQLNNFSYFGKMQILGCYTKHQTSKRGSIHILLDRRGLRTREKKNEITIFQPTRHGTNDNWMNEIRPHDPNPLVGHHDYATKSAQGYS